jgi:hypothetical protein
MKLKKIINGTFDEEKALVNMDTKEMILHGNYYHDKIDEHMEGFLMGLKYVKVKYELLESETITPEYEMFNKCEFWNEED